MPPVMTPWSRVRCRKSSPRWGKEVASSIETTPQASHRDGTRRIAVNIAKLLRNWWLSRQKSGGHILAGMLAAFPFCSAESAFRLWNSHFSVCRPFVERVIHDSRPIAQANFFANIFCIAHMPVVSRYDFADAR
jgi:hypothetical protein